MNDSDKANFARLLMALAELHNRKLSQPLLDIYWHALKSYEYKDVMQSLNRFIVDPDVGQFMPKPADVVRGIDGDGETKALIAWSKVMRAVRHVGSWDSVEFDDYKIHAVIIDMGGWIELCKKPTKELDFLVREFEKRYRAYQHQNVERLPHRLIGKTEQINRYSNGDANIETKYIGVQKFNDTLSKIDIQKKS